MSINKELKNSVMSNYDSHDSWGSAMCILFALCDYMTDKEYTIPAKWEFSQSPMGSDTESYLYQELLLVNPNEKDCLQLGNIINRLISILEKQGKGY